MSHIKPHVAFAAGDVVRATSLAGLGPCPLIPPGHIHSVRCHDAAAHMGSRDTDPETGIPGFCASFRFGLVAQAGNSEPVTVAARMAQVMREREGLTGACTADDLARAGFTSAEIIEFCDEARGIAGAPSDLVAA